MKKKQYASPIMKELKMQFRGIVCQSDGQDPIGTGTDPIQGGDD